MARVDPPEKVLIESSKVSVVFRCGPCRHEEKIPLNKYHGPIRYCDRCDYIDGSPLLKGIIIDT